MNYNLFKFPYQSTVPDPDQGARKLRKIREKILLHQKGKK
jgi:hypothetical protein